MSSASDVPDFESTFGERLADERRRLGLTQEGLARAVDITTRAVVGYEAGTSTVREDILERLAEAGVDLAYLFYGKGPKPYDPALYERVKRWAEQTCVDRRGKPIPKWEQLQRMIRAYRWIAASPTKDERNRRLAELPKSRAA